jgi:predicted metal-dependent hydrolase
VGFLLHCWKSELQRRFAYIDRELADYVIVHELLHFYVPNHGKLWKSLMRAHLGDYERAESKLKIKAAMLSRQQRPYP